MMMMMIMFSITSPNLITLAGLSWMVAALAVALYYTPDLVGPGPSWSYFLYQPSP